MHNNELPLYHVSLEDCDMIAIAIVDEPAVESPLYAFSKSKELFSITNEEQRIVLAPVIRVDYPILRIDRQGNPYNLVFSKEVAEKMVSNYLGMGFAGNINLGHTSFYPESVRPLSFFTKRTDLGIDPLPELYSDVADGSVFAEFKILSDDIWSAIKNHQFNGFSLEAYLDKEPATDLSKLSIEDLLVAILTTK